jgi:hypothetical protein
VVRVPQRVVQAVDLRLRIGSVQAALVPAEVHRDYHLPELAGRLPQTRAGLTCQEQLVDQPGGVGEQGNEFQPSPFGEPERQGSVMDREEFLCGRAA